MQEMVKSKILRQHSRLSTHCNYCNLEILAVKLFSWSAQKLSHKIQQSLATQEVQAVSKMDTQVREGMKCGA